mgnify:FL=1
MEKILPTEILEQPNGITMLLEVDQRILAVHVELSILAGLIVLQLSSVDFEQREVLVQASFAEGDVAIVLAIQ